MDASDTYRRRETPLRKTRQYAAVATPMLGLLVLTGVVVAQEERSDDPFGRLTSPGGTVRLTSQNLSESQRDTYLQQVGLTPFMVNELDENAWAQLGEEEWRLEAPWGEVVQGPGEVDISIFGQSMRVWTTHADEGGVRFEDDWGGSRLEIYRDFPIPAEDCETEPPCFGSSLHIATDAVGPLVEILRNDRGYPEGIRYGEVLVERFHYGSGPYREWSELIDTRTGATVLDTRLATDLDVPPTFRLTTGDGTVLAQADAGGPLSAAVTARSATYAFLPLDGSEIWRSLWARTGGLVDVANQRVDYTDSTLRVYLADHVVIEAPRRKASESNIVLKHPERPLPWVSETATYEAAVPGTTPPEALREHPPTPETWLPSIPGTERIRGLQGVKAAAKGTKMAGGGPDCPPEHGDMCQKPNPVPGPPNGARPGQGNPGPGQTPTIPGGGTTTSGGGPADALKPSKKRKADKAAAKAASRASSCAAIFNGHLSAVQGAPLRDGMKGPSAGSCNVANAYTFRKLDGSLQDDPSRFFVWLCPTAFGRGTMALSTTILHEWAHLAGTSHSDMGGSSSAMSAEINRRCRG